MRDPQFIANHCRMKAETLPASFADVETIALLKTADSTICELYENFVDCRNELCWKCGKYKQAHKGACDGCRWSGVFKFS